VDERMRLASRELALKRRQPELQFRRSLLRHLLRCSRRHRQRRVAAQVARRFRPPGATSPGRYMKLRGFCAEPPTRVSKWQWGPVEFPVLPT
jgi:hypothetical protein